jgi:signal transduction histidine kinase
VVFTHDRHRVAIEPPPRDLQYPLDPLVQIFVNLLQNARDADPTGVIAVRSEPAGDGLRVLIRDHGPGLADEAAAHLFEPFFTTKPPGKGTGLGLYTSYTLAQSLGGQLALEDHPEGGALATVTLPP